MSMRVASIIVTLGTMSIARGIGQVAALGAQRSAGLPDIFGTIGNVPLHPGAAKYYTEMGLNVG